MPTSVEGGNGAAASASLPSLGGTRLTLRPDALGTKEFASWEVVRDTTTIVTFDFSGGGHVRPWRRYFSAGEVVSAAERVETRQLLGRFNAGLLMRGFGGHGVCTMCLGQQSTAPRGRPSPRVACLDCAKPLSVFSAYRK